MFALLQFNRLIRHSATFQSNACCIQHLPLTRIDFVGELIGEAKRRTWLDTDLYVLPTHSENFGISIAEALAHGVPAVVFHGAPWQGLNTRKAGWWIEPTPDALVETLRQAMNLPDMERESMGVNGRCWMQQAFDWNVIGRQMASVYNWLVHNGQQPDFVYK